MIGFLFNMAVLGGAAKTSTTFQQGAMLALGVNPEGGLTYSGIAKNGSVNVTNRQTFFGYESTVKSKTGSSFGQQMAMKSGAGISRFATVAPLLISGYFIYDGFKNDGVKGASDALVYDAAVGTGMAAAQSNYLQQQTYTKALGELSAGEKQAVKQSGAILKDIEKGAKLGFTRTSLKTMSFLGTGLRSGLGASLGQAIGGTPGAFAGAFLGAKAGGLVGNTVMFGAAALGTAAYVGVEKVVSKGATILKKGHERRAFRRRIDTAGDTAAFFTRNANTMRSRAVLSMRNSHLNARSALGMEASMTHMRRDYFSKYG